MQPTILSVKRPSSHAHCGLMTTRPVSPHTSVHHPRTPTLAYMIHPLLQGAEERIEKHVGGLLAPPATPERFEELPQMVPTDVEVLGKTWDGSSVDIAIAGGCTCPRHLQC